jgi:hypothetical protein
MDAVSEAGKEIDRVVISRKARGAGRAVCRHREPA